MINDATEVESGKIQSHTPSISCLPLLRSLSRSSCQRAEPSCQRRIVGRPYRLFSTAVLVSQLGLFSLANSQSSFGQDSGSIRSRLAASPISSVDDLDPAERTKLEKKILKAIQRLGDDSYAAREQAATEIEQIGLLAFDQLREAMLDPDPQIASSAQYLIQSIHQSWTWDTDPIEVKNLLDGYNACSPTDRASRIDRLASQGTEASIAALCRLVRYETHEFLSKHAALSLMRTNFPISPAPRLIRSKTIRQVLGGSQRASCQWLIHFTDWIDTERFDSQWWIKTARGEHENHLNHPSLQGQKNVVELYQWVCQQLAENHEKQSAIELADSMLELLPSTAQQLTTACHWAIGCGIPEWVENVEKKFPNAFRNYARLDYALAESYLIREMHEDAKRIAERTFTRGKGATRFAERHDIAKVLQSRGLFDWSEREYREALKNADPLNHPAMTAFEEFSALLQDLQKFHEAASLWREFVDRLENEPLLRDQVNATFRDYVGKEKTSDRLIERYYFFQAMDAKGNGKNAEAISLLEKCLEINKSDSDVWIELYRISEEKEVIAQRSQPLRADLQETIRSCDQDLLDGGLEKQAGNRSRLALALNELAWLESNTGGDMQEALQCAQRACALEPFSSSCLDTLACVHFHRGELPQALEKQKEAVALSPHSMQLKRVLEKYEKASSEATKSN